MPYITRLDIRRCRNIEALTIDIPPGERGFRHLLLTGPNGSGKSGVLEGLWKELDLEVFIRGAVPSLSEDLPVIDVVHSVDSQRHWLSLRRQRGEEQDWTTHPVAAQWDVHIKRVLQCLTAGKMLVAFYEATRRLRVGEVPGPQRLDPGTKVSAVLRPVSQNWLQHLVNQKVQQALVQSEPDGAEIARRIQSWFDSVRRELGELLEEPALELVFDRRRFDFQLKLPTGYTFDFKTLADGHNAALAIFIDLLLRQALLAEGQDDPSFQPEGVVIIDEIEAHLHLRLQERILPFLTAVFPRLQFIVATHSPAVISSIPDAVVFDLGTRASVLSDDLRGMRFGTLMVEHFGLEDDLDLDSGRKLAELAALAGRVERSPEEETRLRLLADELSARSHTLALEVWRNLELRRRLS